MLGRCECAARQLLYAIKGQLRLLRPDHDVHLMRRYFLNGSSEVGGLLAELAGFGPQSRNYHQQTAEPPDADHEPDESE